VELYLHPQYAFMAWCSVQALGQIYLYLNLAILYRFKMNRVRMMTINQVRPQRSSTKFHIEIQNLLIHHDNHVNIFPLTNAFFNIVTTAVTVKRLLYALKCRQAT